MASKKINELTSKTAVLNDSDYLMVYDSEEVGSEQTKKVAISDYITVINQDLELNVATTGSDVTGDGSVGSPFATINGALEWCKNKTTNDGVTITITLAAGTWNDHPVINIYGGSSRIVILGDFTTPSNVTINFATGSHGINIYGPSMREFHIQGLTINGFDYTEWNSGILTYYGAVVYLQKVLISDFGNGVYAFFNSNIIAKNGCTFDGGYNGAFAQNFSKIDLDGCTISNNNNGISAQLRGEVMTDNCTFTGNSSNTWTATGGVTAIY
jgi:hypothetical protein